MPRFNRVYRLLVGQPGKNKGVEINDLKITFDIEKSVTPYPNRSNIRVWNLRPDHREQFERPDTRVMLYAGYEEEAGPLLCYAGAVSFAFSEHEGPDWVTNLELRDGGIEIRDTMITLSYGPGASAKQITAAISKQMGLPLYMDSSLADRTWASGFSYYGAARIALNKITAGAGYEWSIQNGTVQVMKRASATRREAVLLSADSGMIGYPHRERKLPPQPHVSTAAVPRAPAKKRFSLHRRIDGWRIKSLLLPQLNAGDPVSLESQTIQGTYRVERLRHIGDSFGGDWITEIYIGKAAQSD